MKCVRVSLLPALLICAAGTQPVIAGNVRVAPVEAARPTGAKVYAKWCSDCHTSPTGPGSIGLQRKYQGAVPAVLEKRTDLTADYVKLAVRKGISFMPSFRKTEISDDELALVSAYLTHSQTGKMTKPPRSKPVKGAHK